MPVSLRCVKAENHPDADRLQVYLFEDLTFPGGSRQIVANTTNIYTEGDLVDVVLPGEEFEGRVLQKAKIRGIDSFGMAVGLTKKL